jgi:hypothetical protein
MKTNRRKYLIEFFEKRIRGDKKKIARLKREGEIIRSKHKKENCPGHFVEDYFCEAYGSMSVTRCQIHNEK